MFSWALVALVLVVVSFSVSAYSFSRYFEGGISHEFCQYAEIARNVLEGRGFHTATVWTSTLAWMDSRGIPFSQEHLAPVMARFPLQSALTAGAMLLVGKTDAAPALLSVLMAALCAVATFVAGCVFFSPLEGFLAALLFVFNPSFQRGFVLWGLPDFGFCFLVLLTVTVLCWARDQAAAHRETPKLWAAAGLLSGLAFLQRENLLLWVPLFLWFVWQRGTGSKKRFLMFCGGLGLGSAPGWIYNLRWFGGITPPAGAWNLLEHVVQDTSPWLSYREFSVAEAWPHMDLLANKFWHYLLWQLMDFPTLWQMHFLFPFLLVGAWGLRKQPFVRLMGSMMLVQLIVFSFLRYETLGYYVKGRYILWFAPTAFLLSMRGASFVGEKLRWGRACPIGLAVLSLGFFGYFWSRPQGGARYPGGLRVQDWPELRASVDAAGPDGLIATNLPAQVTWYARGLSVALPATPADFLALDRQHAVTAVLISRLSPGELYNTPAWGELLGDSGSMKGFCQASHLIVLKDFGTSLLLIKSPKA